MSKERNTEDKDKALHTGGVSIMLSEVEENAEKWGDSKNEDGEEIFYGYHYDTAYDSFIGGVKWLVGRLKDN